MKAENNKRHIIKTFALRKMCKLFQEKLVSILYPEQHKLKERSCKYGKTFLRTSYEPG